MTARLGFAALVFSLCCGCASGFLTDGGFGGGTTGGSGGGSATGGGVGGGGGSSDDAGLPLNAACSTLNAARCAYLTRCGLVGQGQVEQSDCLAWLQATWCGPSNWPTMVNPHVATLRYDGVAAASCADGFAAAECHDYDLLPQACDHFLLPNVLLNQSCYDGYDECTQGVCRGAACPRTCQPLGMNQDACRLDDDCRSDLYCKLISVTVGTGLCTPRGGLSDSCGADAPCASMYKCVGSKCVSPPVSGQPCLGTVCDSSAYCQAIDGGLCTLRNGMGISCTDDVQCQSGLICQLASTNSTCQPQQLPKGSACSLAQTCLGGTTCVGASANQLGMCSTPLDAGMPCAASTDCNEFEACVSADGGIQRYCGARQGPGGRCNEDRECEYFTVCRQSSCVSLPTRGASCAVTRQCLTGACISLDGGYLCVDPLSAGASCTGNADCASGMCTQGQCMPSCTP
ncbi:MAG: hypothetical protein QM723_22470 [Myxococcaceae bacterium]